MWQRDEPLQKHTTFRIGGRAAWYCRPSNLDELRQALAEARALGVPVKLLGGGSNLLVDDCDLDIAVIHIASPAFSAFEVSGEEVRAGAGLRLTTFLRKCAKLGVSGLESLSGIPGTIGGAVVGNAGANGASISDRVRSVTVLDDALNPVKVSPSEAGFGYRTSDLHGHIVVEVELLMVRREPRDITIDLTRHRERKLSCQPVHACSAGCIFKNPNGDSAGRLIDLCGLKGRRIGDAEVCAQHANFIVNRDGATAADVLRLMGLVHQSVESLFHVDLEPEIEHWAA